MSLPAVFGTTVETVPWPGAYLGAMNPTAVSKTRSRIQISRSRDGLDLRVGIAWAGNPRYKADRQRSMQLETLLPLLRAARCTLDFAAERANAAEQIAELTPRRRLCRDGSSRDRDLAETAALDCHRSTSSSPPTPASPTWPEPWASPCGFCCRIWPTGAGCRRGRNTPWYPTARLFRQARARRLARRAAQRALPRFDCFQSAAPTSARGGHPQPARLARTRSHDAKVIGKVVDGVQRA